MKKNIAVFASGRGSNLEAILRKIESGDLKNTTIEVVVSNNSRSGALELARGHGIRDIHLSSLTHPDSRDFEKAHFDLLEAHRIDLILLSGYMKKLPAGVVRTYSRKILNIHPALLPRHGGKGMYGLAVHRAVIDSGDNETGVTVHYVDENFDTGTVIRQKKVPVKEGDDPESLAARVLKVEHDLFWRVVDNLINGTQRNS